MSRNCRVCGRYLPSLRSQRKGIGPRCLARVRAELASEFHPYQSRKATDLLRKHSLRRLRRGVYTVRSKGERYLTSKNACTCPSGRYRPFYGSCYHQLAVREVEEATEQRVVSN